MEKVLNNEEKLKVSQYNLIIDRLKELEDLVQDVEINRDYVYYIYDENEQDNVNMTYYDVLVDLESRITDRVNTILFKKQNNEVEYETTIILKDDLSSIARGEVAAHLKDTLENKIRAKIENFDVIGKQKLAYTCKGYNTGYYLGIKFRLNKDDIETGIRDWERDLRITEEILKFITIKVDEINFN